MMIHSNFARLRSIGKLPRARRIAPQKTEEQSKRKDVYSCGLVSQTQSPASWSDKLLAAITTFGTNLGERIGGGLAGALVGASLGTGGRLYPNLVEPSHGCRRPEQRSPEDASSSGVEELTGMSMTGLGAVVTASGALLAVRHSLGIGGIEQ